MFRPMPVLRDGEQMVDIYVSFDYIFFRNGWNYKHNSALYTLVTATAQENEIQNMKDCVSSPNEEMVSMSVV
jgi:hypothetical protein